MVQPILRYAKPLGRGLKKVIQTLIRHQEKIASDPAAIPQRFSQEKPQPQKTVLLKYTGTCNEAEFKAKCKEHDFWYHSYYFDNGFVQRGDYDIGRDIAS